MLTPNIIGWKSFIMPPIQNELLVGGRNPKQSKSWRVRGKPWYYFGPVCHRHAHPKPDNPHGIWTFRTLDELYYQGYSRCNVLAKVAVFGKVLKYKNIYRSSHILFLEMWVRTMSAEWGLCGSLPNAKLIEARYQCPVHEVSTISQFLLHIKGDKWQLPAS